MSSSPSQSTEAEVADLAGNELIHAPSEFQKWFMQEGAWWCASFVFHMLLMVLLMLFGDKVMRKAIDDAPKFDAVDEQRDKSAIAPDKLEMFHLNKNTSLEASELSTDTLMLSAAPDVEATGTGDQVSMVDRSRQSAGPNLGGLGGFDIKAVGPGAASRGKGVGGSLSSGAAAGGGGDGSHGFVNRSGSKKNLVGGFGGTKASERSVAASLNWFARHQNTQNGSWSFVDFGRRCKGGKEGTCGAPGDLRQDSAATALALLPFLAAGQTHETRGPYKSTIYSGLWWLLSAQKPNGDLRVGGTMYAHGLASICLCEAYGLTGDKELGKRAQAAINFIQAAQNSNDGGWRYTPGQAGDTSVVGWQLMALKSAQMAGLKVDPQTIEKTKKFLSLVASGPNKGLYGYTEPGAGPTTTAVGMLCQQYMGMKRDHPSMVEGTKFLLRGLPDNRRRNCYHWYYATQVMHNMPGTDWDNWNRAMRRVLIETQSRDGCSTGSWDPTAPTKDPWSQVGGRLYMTSLATLTLEVYYRYLPLYKLDSESAVSAAGAGSGRPNFDEEEKPAPKPDAKPGAKPDAKPATDAKPGAKPEAKPATDAKPGAKPEAKPATDAKPGAKPEAKPATDAKPGAKPEAKPATDAKPGAKPEAKPATDAKPGAKPEAKPATDAKPGAKPEAKPATDAKPGAKPATDAKPGAKPATDAKPGAKPATDAKPEAKPAEKK